MSLKTSIVVLLSTCLLLGGCYATKKYVDTEVDERVTSEEPLYRESAEKSYQELKEQEKIDKEKSLEQEVKDLNLPKATGISKGKFFNEYAETWSLYQSKDTELSFLLPNNKGGYIAGEGRESFGLIIGKDTVSTLKAKYGNPLTSITKGNTIYQQSKASENTAFVYLLEGYYVTFFIDTFDNDEIHAVHYVKQEIEEQKDGYFGSPSDSLRDSFEDSMVYLINQSRTENGLAALTYDKSLNTVARKHSQDMVDKNYFSHTGSDGTDARTRMENAGYEEHLYAENIAYGQYSSMHAHEALMNSEGHRENILNRNLTHMGVGVAFKTDGTPMYTINFYTPFD